MFEQHRRVDPGRQHDGGARAASSARARSSTSSPSSLHDLSADLASVGERDAAFPLPHGRGDEVHHGGPGPTRASCRPRACRPRDIYVPDLHIDTIKVKAGISTEFPTAEGSETMPSAFPRPQISQARSGPPLGIVYRARGSAPKGLR